MCCKRLAAFAAVCLLPIITVQAQPNLPLVRSWADKPVLFATFNTERYQKSGSFLYAQVQQALNQQGFSAVLGYEQRLTRHWFAGISVIPSLLSNDLNRFSYSLNASHTGRIGKWQFLKQVSYTLQSDLVRQIGTPSQRAYYNSFGFAAGIARNFSIGAQTMLRPIVSYQAAVFPGSNIYPRTVDQTRAQVELAWFPKEHYSIGLFFAQSTDYFIALARFDANGNVIEPERRLNLNTALIGLRLHLLLNLQQVESREQMRMLFY
jgi:hypothetical protein